MKNILIEVKNLQKSFKKANRKEELIIDDVNFNMHQGEIIALLGKTGSGKSTLMRIIAGLTKPSQGEVIYRGQAITEPAKGIAMVFQNFAILPWLTVLENVQLGLEALGVNKNDCRTRAIEAIDRIGLDGFESAYPKELSGGMQQRVGIARALVVNPDILLMDEPFSALDVLTSENLRRDILDLWQNNKIGTKSILFVTHNIQEAALLADRIIIFGSSPGHIRADLSVNLPHPRNVNDDKFRKLIDDIYTLMTTSESEIYVRSIDAGFDYEKIDFSYRLPDAGVNELTGLLEELNREEHHGTLDLPDLANNLQYEADTLFPLTEMSELLGFAKVYKGDIEITNIGKKFISSDILQRKQIFAKQLAKHVPLASHILKHLSKDENKQVSEDLILAQLQEHLSKEEADRVLTVIIDWGRYAEIFAYDYDSGIINLENPN